jgi:hypothetical protein
MNANINAITVPTERFPQAIEIEQLISVKVELMSSQPTMWLN